MFVCGLRWRKLVFGLRILFAAQIFLHFEFLFHPFPQSKIANLSFPDFRFSRISLSNFKSEIANSQAPLCGRLPICGEWRRLKLKKPVR